LLDYNIRSSRFYV